MRDTYVLRSGKLIPKSQATPLPSKGYFSVIPDIAPFVTQDGTPITSRRSLREYEQAHGVRQVGNDFASFHRQLRNKVYGTD